MILKELRKNRYIRVNYYENGLLKTCQGRIWNLNIYDQSLTLKDDQQKPFSISLSGIKDIYELKIG